MLMNVCQEEQKRLFQSIQSQKNQTYYMHFQFNMTKKM